MHRMSLPIKAIDTSNFYVITSITNPARYRVRYDLYRKFAQHMEASGAQLYTIEAALGHRHFEITEADNPRHIQLRTSSEIWHKENLINIAMSRLPANWQYVAWVDADVMFMRPDWVNETVQQLQHYDMVQMWSTAHDLDPNIEGFRTYRSFMSCYMDSIHSHFATDPQKKKVAMMPPPVGYYHTDDKFYAPGEARPHWHPGYAWAARRSAIDHLGGLIHWAILGSADRHMALALIGQVDISLPPQGLSRNPRYYQMLKMWEFRAEKYLKRNIGVVPGAINHFWHGRKSSRRYADRWDILIRNGFDPDYDLKLDAQGLWQLTDHNFVLRDDLRYYFAQRQEDGIEND